MFAVYLRSDGSEALVARLVLRANGIFDSDACSGR